MVINIPYTHINIGKDRWTWLEADQHDYLLRISLFCSDFLSQKNFNFSSFSSFVILEFLNEQILVLFMLLIWASLVFRNRFFFDGKLRQRHTQWHVLMVVARWVVLCDDFGAGETKWNLRQMSQRLCRQNVYAVT